MNPVDLISLGILGGVIVGTSFYELGLRHGRERRRLEQDSVMATVELDWVNETPVAVTVKGNPADVMAWMEAARETSVLHV